jgi:serine/threonine protein kinase/tetratricopeptide (TPR) repeat protein
MSDQSFDDETVSNTEPLESPPRSLERGACIDRYIIVDRLGSGGMGVVYKAFDPDLGRPVAVKLLNVDPQESSRQRQRLLREAQALAKLSHPNVISVHDVGTVGDDVFIAMEFVEGRTLRAWLTQTKRSVREVLDVFLAAGEGLAAAHRAGLVHRDFKPDNVMVGDDGRVRVLDFGLAKNATLEQLPADGGAPSHYPQTGGDTVDLRAPGTTRRAGERETPPTPAAPLQVLDSGRLLATPLTRIGSVLGTPRYMAPEQHLGEAVDERADQFSFCLSLYEALYDALPFVGSTRREAVLEGRVEEPPAGARVPRWLRQVLVRGLAVDPVSRYASMASLLAALRADPTVARRRRMIAVATLAMLGITALAWRIQLRHQASLCRGAERKLVGVWDPGRRVSVRTAFRSSGARYADAVLQTVERAFDDYAQSWLAMDVDACEATRVRREQPSQVLDLRVACLDDRLFQLKTLVDVFATADAKLVEGATQSARSLPSLDLCTDVAALAARTPPRDPEMRRRVEDVRQQLAGANALGLAARYDQGVVAAQKAVAEAQKLDYRPIEAEAELQLGTELDGHGDYRDAEHAFSQALAAATDAHGDELATRATVGLIRELGVRLSKFDDADRWALLGESQARQLQRKDELLGRFYSQRSALRRAESRYDEALADANRALEIQKRALGPDHDSVAETYCNLADIHWYRSHFAEALESYGHCLAIDQRNLGFDHPRVALTLNGMANVYGDSGDHTRALELYQRALEILKRVQPDHPSVALIYNNIGGDLYSQGKASEAFENFKFALEAWQKRFGPSQRTVMALNNMASAKVAMNQPAEALRYAKEGVAMCERVLGPSHQACGVFWGTLGEAHRGTRQLDEALRDFQRAAAVIEKAVGNDHPDLVLPLLGIGRVNLARHAATDAKAPLERALAIREKQPGDGLELADVRFTLAQAWWQIGNRLGARSLVLQAHATYAKAGAGTRQALAETETWLEAHH